MEINSRIDIDKNISIIKEKLLTLLPQEGVFDTAIKGLHISKRTSNDKQENCFYKPSIAIIIQGHKNAVIGSEKYEYGEKQCLVVGVDIPSMFYISKASKEKPFLAISLDIDKYLISQLISKLEISPQTQAQKCLSVEYVSPEILDAFVRLVDLLDKPEHITLLAPIIIEEIYSRLLLGSQGSYLCNLNTLGSNNNKIMNVIQWLTENYKANVQIEDLAKQVNMGVSTFHRHFKEATTLSPLQFHKRLRLYEAQRLMLMENNDANSASFAVGYLSPAQFNREYRKMFGQPPHRDVKTFLNAK